MASRKSKKKKPPERTLAMDSAMRSDIVGVLLIAIGGVTLLTVLSITRGALSEAWLGLLRRIFGWGVYLVGPAMIVTGLMLVWDDLRARLRVTARVIFGLEILFVSLLGLAHLLAGSENSLGLAQRGGGGGYIGWAVSHFLSTAVGRGGGLLLLLPAAIIGLGLSLDLDWSSLRFALARARERLADLSAPTEPVEEAPAVPKARARQVEPPATPQPAPVQARPKPRRRRVRRTDRRLPSLDLLNGGDRMDYGDADAQYKKQVIEDTLASFGVPAEVVEIDQGPTVTLFGVEPGFVEQRRSDGTVRRRKIRVSEIMALQNDLALALAAAPIRIQAPVPGRSVVGIEVPNSEVSLVGLRGVMESKAFESIDSKLRLALGRNVAGEPIAADLELMPHLLIAGATGSGKSVCINALTTCMLFNNTPDDLRLIMIDPKMVELTLFDGIPHLLAPVIVGIDEAVQALRWVTLEMDRRYRLFSDSATRSIETYNQLMASRGREQLPNVVIIIDELADLMMVSPDEVERSITRIAQLARATGIHLIVATQRPSVDVVTGLIKANFPARISFAVTSQVDSRVILDNGGAEKLLGRGDLLYMSSDSSKLVRLQGCFVADEEVERLVRFWRDKIDWIIPEDEAPAPWSDMAAEEQQDELLPAALELARGRNSISTSFLQRRLHIGYPRAARLIDIMEAQGLIGPAESAGRSREVYVDDYQPDDGGDDSFPPLPGDSPAGGSR
jgi:S-DNA-T family DNA segregation ATPase FtsK/SpoIIIE